MSNFFEEKGLSPEKRERFIKYLFRKYFVRSNIKERGYEIFKWRFDLWDNTKPESIKSLSDNDLEAGLSEFENLEEQNKRQFKL